MKKVSDLSLQTITIIQVILTTVISLLYQLVFPLSWQPLDAYEYGVNVQHGDKGTNLVIFTMTQWYFSLSLAWLIYRDNPYINNFLVYSIVPLSMIAFAEFIVLGLYYDYIHLFPLIVDIYLLGKKRKTLEQRFVKYYLPLTVGFMFSVYLLRLAYYHAALLEFTFNMIVNTSLAVGLSFTFRKKSDISGEI